MADLSTTYTLTWAGNSIIFNDGTPGDGSDLYWIHAIHGLDGPTIRAPVDDMPYGDGGLIHKFWRGPRRISFEGVIIIQSVPTGGSCQARSTSWRTTSAGSSTRWCRRRGRCSGTASRRLFTARSHSMYSRPRTTRFAPSRSGLSLRTRSHSD